MLGDWEGSRPIAKILDGSGSLVSSDQMQLVMEEDSGHGAGGGGVAHK